MNRMEQLLAFCDWERKHNPSLTDAPHIAEWAADEIERLKTDLLEARGYTEALDRENDALRKERDTLKLEAAICREAIEQCLDIVQGLDCMSDSDSACQRVTLRRLNEAIGEATPRLLYERPEGQRLYGLRFRELAEERDALRLDAERFRWIDEKALGVDMVADPDNLVQVWHSTLSGHPTVGRTLREAIDAAMKEKP